MENENNQENVKDVELIEDVKDEATNNGEEKERTPDANAKVSKKNKIEVSKSVLIGIAICFVVMVIIIVNLVSKPSDSYTDSDISDADSYAEIDDSDIELDGNADTDINATTDTGNTEVEADTNPTGALSRDESDQYLVDLSSGIGMRNDDGTFTVNVTLGNYSSDIVYSDIVLAFTLKNDTSKEVINVSSDDDVILNPGDETSVAYTFGTNVVGGSFEYEIFDYKAERIDKANLTKSHGVDGTLEIVDVKVEQTIGRINYYITILNKSESETYGKVRIMVQEYGSGRVLTDEKIMNDYDDTSIAPLETATIEFSKDHNFNYEEYSLDFIYYESE